MYQKFIPYTKIGGIVLTVENPIPPDTLPCGHKDSESHGVEINKLTGYLRCVNIAFDPPPGFDSDWERI